MNTARDNFFKECPAIMNYSTMTDYRNKHRREQYIRTINGAPTDYHYKTFLQQNAQKIMMSDWTYHKIEYSCQPNACIHRSPTSPPAGDFNDELKRYNAVRTTGNQSLAQCPNLEGYKMC